MGSQERRDMHPMARWHRFLADKTELPFAAEVRFGLQYDNIGDFGARNHIYEFWTKEYIDAFGGYLAARIAPLAAEKKGKATILEVGAGDGRLSHFLREEGLSEANALCDVHAVDNGSWEIPSPFPVEQMSNEEALQRYQPDIVIASWVPEGLDITPALRATPSVREYILIGDPNNCGANETYGISPDLQWGDWSNEEKRGIHFRNPSGYIPPFAREGFEMVNLPELSRLQIGLTDDLGQISRSRTMSFRRK